MLLTGESGTGKELAARMLHELSPRAGAPFVPIHCAAIPEPILESELFGYERGAFTGAGARKEGRFERAHGGTVFLDEVGEMSPAVQVKLLRVLQDGVVERLGGTQPLRVDVRLVAATNKELAAEVRAGRFREDLFYRLDVVAIRLPPLRERREDVPLLASAFLRRLSEKHAKPAEGFTQGALAALAGYGWPGNVRELEHAVERAVVLSRGGPIKVSDLPEAVRAAAPEPAANGGRMAAAAAIGEPLASPGSLTIRIGTPMEEVERQMIRETLRHTGGDKSLTAQLLGIAPRTIYRKLDRDEEGRLVGSRASQPTPPEEAEPPGPAD